MNDQTKQDEDPRVILDFQLKRQIPEFAKILPPGITPDQFARVAQTAILNNVDLIQCERGSLFRAMMKACEDGLLPDGRQGALVPHRKSVKTGFDQQTGKDIWKTFLIAQWMPMRFGLIKRLWEVGRLRLQVKVVYPGDEFDYQEGDEPRIVHKPKSDGNGRSEDIVAVYSIARDENDRIVGRDVMRKAEIDQIRALARSEKGPWSNPVFYPEMALKTVIHHHFKNLPVSDQLMKTATRDDWMYTEKPADQLGAPVVEQALLPSPDIFPRSMPGEPLHVAPERSQEAVLNALAGGAPPPQQQRRRRTKAEIEADKAREAAAKAPAPNQGSQQPVAADPFSGPASGSSTTREGASGGGGPGSDRLVVLDGENRPYYADTGEYLETSQDYDHEEDEAKGSEAQGQGQGQVASVAQAPATNPGTGGNQGAPPANTNIDTAPKDGGQSRQLTADQTETRDYLRRMTDAVNQRPIATKDQWIQFVDHWLFNAGDNGNHWQAVRDYVAATSNGKQWGVEAHDIRSIADNVQKRRAQVRGNPSS